MRSALVLLLSVLFFNVYAQDAVPASIYGMKIPAYKGGTIDLSQYKGKKILIVNMPYDPDNMARYQEFETFYQQHKDKVVVIGLLADDFQIRPGTKLMPYNTKRAYNVTFPLAAKVAVRGTDMAPVYQWLTQQKYNHVKDYEIGWDYQKFLIDEQGNLAGMFHPAVKANSPQILAAIEK
jgi:glutathione peroxidase